MKKIPDREKIPDYYVEGMSAREIGKKVGLTVGAVYSILKARGVKTRTPKEAHAVRFPEGRFGAIASNWKGGRRHAKHGKAGETDDTYIYIYDPEHPYATKAGYVMEHRLVVEKRLGRYLLPSEVVHHLNGKKTDNRDDNLELIDSRGEHVRLHFKAIAENATLREQLQNLFTQPVRCIRCGDPVGEWDDHIKDFRASAHAVDLGRDYAFLNPGELSVARHRPVTCCHLCYPDFQRQVAAA